MRRFFSFRPPACVLLALSVGVFLLQSGPAAAAADPAAARGGLPRTGEEARGRQLAAAIERLLAASGVPGAAVALVDVDGRTWIRGFGKANLASGAEVRPSTVFRTGSVSKSFIALALLKLHEQGKVDLADRVSDLAPELSIDNPWDAASPVRVAHLLEHTSGFDDMTLAEVVNRDDRADIPLLEVFRKFPGPQRARWRPGTKVAYSNPGYAVAGYLVEKLTGRAFEDYVKTEILDPLGMSGADFRLTGSMKGRLATSYEGSPPRPIPYRPTYMRPGGELKSSAEDMARWVAMLLNRGRAGSVRVCSASSVARMERGETSSAARAGLDYSLGAGIETSLDRRLKTLGKGGAIDGFLATYQYLPDHGLGYVILLNADSVSALSGIEGLVFDFLTVGIATAAQPAVARRRPEELQRLSGYYEPTNPRSEAGRFLDVLTRGRRVFVAEGSLFLRDLLQEREKLVPLDGGRFRLQDQPEASMIFVPQPGGGMVLAGREATYERVNPVWPYLRIVSLAAALGVLLTVPLVCAGALAGKWTGRLREPRLLPLVLAALAAALLIVMAASFASLFGSLDPRGAPAHAIFLATLAFPVVSIAVPWAVAAAARRPRKVWTSCYLWSVAISCLLITADLAAWHLIGFRPWSY